MTTHFRPRRSVLYMSGSNSRALKKARNLPTDCLIFDLEDAVAPEAKDIARSQVAATIRAGGYDQREIIIRTNAVETEWFTADAAAVAASSADAILLPKVESPAVIKEAIRQLSKAGAAADLPIWIMAETPRGLLNLDDIIATEPRIEVIIMGTSDLSKEMRIQPSTDRSGLIHALSHCLLTARAHGLDIIDGVHLTLDDPDGLLAACKQGRNLGFDGKSLIHPQQIAPANETFGISDKEAETAREIIHAWDVARNEGQGITVFNGQLIEQLHVDEAKRILAIHLATIK
ncbi:MAG: CoA ester lyase [Gammaproteobacteria bacterium]|nr:CoA ester lyase [Gammaproteobacteria bacterium]